MLQVKSLAAELGMDRADVLTFLKDPPPDLLLMSAQLAAEEDEEEEEEEESGPDEIVLPRFPEQPPLESNQQLLLLELRKVLETGMVVRG